MIAVQFAQEPAVTPDPIGDRFGTGPWLAERRRTCPSMQGTSLALPSHFMGVRVNHMHTARHRHNEERVPKRCLSCCPF